MSKESYKLEKDDFEGADVCAGCRKRIGSGPCLVYGEGGQKFRKTVGYCPAVNRYASWRKDKPVEVKNRKRVGQQKQR